MKLELHMHTADVSGCADDYSKDSIPSLKEYGYDGAVITEHLAPPYMRDFFGEEFAADGRNYTPETWERFMDRYMEGYYHAKSIGDKIGFKVFPGAEVNLETSPNDYLLYGDVEPFLRSHPFIFKMDSVEFSEEVRKYGKLFLVHAHPFRPGEGPVEGMYLDGIECYNANRWRLDDNNNDLANNYAMEHGYIRTVGSDYHALDHAGGTCMNFYNDFDTPEELVNALRNEAFDKIIWLKHK